MFINSVYICIELSYGNYPLLGATNSHERSVDNKMGGAIYGSEPGFEENKFFMPILERTSWLMVFVYFSQLSFQYPCFEVPEKGFEETLQLRVM